MRIIMIDDNGRQSDITNDVQNILRNQNIVASDRMNIQSQEHEHPGFMPRTQQPVQRGGFMPHGERPMQHIDFTPHIQQPMMSNGFAPQGQMVGIPVDEFGNPMAEIPEGESFEGFIPQPAPMEFNGQTQRPMMERPVMGHPAPMEFNGQTQRPMMERPTMRQQPMTRFGAPSARNFDEAAHRFAQHMVNGNRHMPMGSNRPVQSPNYRRSY